MPSLCQLCSLEVFGPAGWHKLWASECDEGYLNLDYERSYADLLASAELRCWFCRLIVNACGDDGTLEELLSTDNELSCNVEIYHQSHANLTPGTIGFFTVHGNVYAGETKERNMMDFGKDTDEVYFDFDVGVTTTPDNSAAMKFLAPTPITGKYTNFDPKIALAWLRHCTNSHSQCYHDPQSSIPKRVLDCSQRSTGSQIYLIETPEDQRADYAALSYVWGGPQPFLTLTSNIAEHTAGIEMAKLPNTLQDAVHVTRALGLRYLWIDALCIVQDSSADKVSEIGRMNQYYRDAFVVIAASKSNTVTDGFLKTSTASGSLSHPPGKSASQSDHNFEVPFTSPHGKTGSLLLEANPQTYCPGHNPLNTRCWAFQERLLCPRILQFPDADGFAMQCNDGERFAGKMTYRPEAIKGRERMMQPVDRYGDVKKHDLTPEDIHGSWLSIICEYADMNVSVPGDRLVAIAALAEEYHRLHPGLGTYLGGHWSAYLVHSLHWTVFIPRHELQAYRAPSWSWASVEGATYDAHGTIEGHAHRGLQILESTTSPAEGTLPFGAVASGHLQVRARLEQVRWRRRNQYTAQILEIGDETEQQQQQQQIAEAYPDTIENMPQAGATETVFLMDLHTSDDPSGDSRRLVSLVLRECGPDTFRRVGKAFAYASDDDDFPVRGKEAIFHIV